MTAYGNGGSSSVALSKSLRHLPTPQDYNEKKATTSNGKHGDEAELVNEFESSSSSPPPPEVKIDTTSQFTVNSNRIFSMRSHRRDPRYEDSQLATSGWRRVRIADITYVVIFAG